MKITKPGKIVTIVLLFLFLPGLLAFASYYFSKRSAEQLVGETLQYFPLSKVRITIAPFHRKYPVWMFRFSYPDSFDEEFEIYTTVFGNIDTTNPTDLEQRLRKFEKIEPHPYSKEAQEQTRLEQIKNKEIAHEKGVRLSDNSSFKEDFKEHFTLSDIEAPENTSTYGVYFLPEPEWWATLSPKKSYSLPCKVMAVFPIKDNKIVFSITPEEIEGVLDKCFSHPYISNYITNYAVTGIRLRITGDRLHWNTPELQKFLIELKGGKAKGKELRNWANIIIDDQKNQFFSFYLNRISGELIYTDTTANCSKPILVPIKTIE